MSRLDLSDLCFVDELVSLLIFWRKSQLSRFAEMVSQVLESGRLRVNKNKLEVLVGAAGPGARRINAEIARGAHSSHFGAKQFEPPQLLSTSGVRWSLREARAEAQIRVTQAQARYSRGL